MKVKLRYPKYVRVMAFVMLIAIFHYVAGYRLLYSLGILYAKEEAKECLMNKPDKMKKLTISAFDYANLKWSDEHKEFSYNNEMYDVATIQKLNADYIITVYQDDNETGVVLSFHNFEKELFHPDQSSKGAKSAEDLMSSFQKEFMPSSDFRINMFAIDRLLQPISDVSRHSQQVPGNIWHPPLLS